MEERELKRGKTTEIGGNVLGFLVVIFAIMVIRTAWIGDDAYFTLRTVDNFINGYGLTWNIDERVQAYTHPLWMFAISAVYFITHEAFYTTLFLSISISTLVFWLAVRATPDRSLASAAILCVLILSKAFMDYSTSGLENPATHLLLIAFMLLLLREQPQIDEKGVFWMSLLAGLAILNRMDTVLFYVPALVYIFGRARSWRTARALVLGFMPFVLWEVFSVIYYGFPFPNPAYAKLGTDIGHRELISQGIQYFLYSLRWDPITLTTIAAALILTAIQGTWPQRSVAMGIALYLAYVVWIGGDFMSGRYFSGPLLGAVVLLTWRLGRTLVSEGILTLALILTLAFMAPSPPLRANCWDGNTHSESGVSDIRAFHFGSASIACRERSGIEPHSTWALNGLALKESGTKASMPATGYLGYFAGPQVHIIDDFGLADALMARLPYRPRSDKWWIGHFTRRVPRGYLETVESGENLLKPENVAQYYDKLRLVTSGPLWSLERFATIWELNTGQADWLIRDYRE